MQDTDTLQTADPQISSESSRPPPTWTTQVAKFPGVPQRIIWNQFKPALKSSKLMKTLKLTASCSILFHF